MTLKKTISIFITACLLLCVLNVTNYQSLASGGAPFISVSDVYGKIGDTVDVGVSINNNPGITGMILHIDYDQEILKLTRIVDKGVLGEYFHNINSSPLTLMWSNGLALNNYTVNGEIAVLRFTILKEASSSPIIITYKHGNILNYNLQHVPFEIENGSVSTTGSSGNNPDIEPDVTPGNTPDNNDPIGDPENNPDNNASVDNNQNNPGGSSSMNPGTGANTGGSGTGQNDTGGVGANLADTNNPAGSASSSPSGTNNPVVSPVAPTEKPFEDVKESDWFYSYVMFVRSRGLMNGTSTEPMLFSPDVTLTRGMLVTILYNMENKPDIAGMDILFTDVPQNAYYADAVKLMTNINIVHGYGNGLFGPDDPITRQDFTVILTRYANYAGMSFKSINTYVNFNDDSEIAGYAKDAVELCYEAGIIVGKPNNNFDPLGNATRAEAATMLQRFIINSENDADGMVNAYVD